MRFLASIAFAMPLIMAAADPDAGGGGGADFDTRLKAAIDQLDHARDQNWTKDGLPAVPVLVDLLQTRVTRGDVERVAGGFVRMRPQDAAVPADQAEAQRQLDTKHAVEALAGPQTATDRAADRHRTDVETRPKDALDDDTAMFRDGGPVWRGLSPRRIYQRRAEIIETLEKLESLVADVRGAPGELTALTGSINDALTSMKRFATNA